MKIDQELCILCGACLPYCPMNAISQEDEGMVIDQEECVECSICRHADVCPTDALAPPELTWPRALRRVFSDPLATHEGTGVPGRGTEEMKTNDVTGRFLTGWAGMAAEIGRPGTGTRFTDVEKVAMAVAPLGVEFEPKNPVTFLMTDQATGQIQKDVLEEKVLSAIVEFSVKLEKVPEVLNALREVANKIDTVFSVDLASRVARDGSVPTVALAEAAGFTPSINGKINVGLGKPLYKEGQR